MLYVLIVIFNTWIFAAEENAPKTPVPAAKEAAKAASTPAPGGLEVFNADVFDLDGTEKMFTFQSDRTIVDGKLTYSSRFKDLNGEVVAQENAEINNWQIVKFESERTMTKDKGLIEGRDGRLFFTYTDHGKKSTKWENAKPDTLVSASLCPFLESHWDDLMAKKDVKFYYAVWYRQETVQFKFFYDKEEGGNVTFQMVPTNIFYRSLVNPLFITYKKSNKKLVSIKGRTVPKVKKKDAWRDFDAFIKYH